MPPVVASADAVLDPLIEAVPGGFVLVSAEGAVLNANAAATAFLGFTYDKLTNRYTQDFVSDTYFEDGSPCPLDAYPVSVTLTTGKPAGPTTIGVRQPDGQVRWAVFRAVPVDGGGAVVTFLDITERRAAERRVRISDRLASLGRLAAGVAHEINNPLTWVMLELERAAENEDLEGAVRSVERARGGLERIASIVADLGAFARVEDDELEPFEVRQALDSAVSIVRTEIQHRAELQIEPFAVPPALGVSGKAIQIVLNLLTNAAQAIEPGAREANRVTVRAHFDPEKAQVCIEVADTGAGMDPFTLEHAGDPFFTTKDPGEGTGLGLSISHALADAMQGSLELESVRGKGTIARLFLPAVPLDDSTSDPEPVPESSRTGKVLLIDDEPEILRVMSWALERHDVDTAAHGRDALERIASDQYDVIVCDLMMPEVTGMMLHAALLESHPELAARVVFVTGGAYTPEAQAFLEREGICWIEKPFSVDQLRRAVDDLLPERVRQR